MPENGRTHEPNLRELTAQLDALRDLLDTKVTSLYELINERHQRYQDVAQEKEKALHIKEEADRSALLLARDIQTYKDEKANQLREQINQERGTYVSKQELAAVADRLELLIRPALDYMSAQEGRARGIQLTTGMLFALIGAAGTIAFLIAKLMGKG